jgi:excisionase family DNA binding protein
MAMVGDAAVVLREIVSYIDVARQTSQEEPPGAPRLTNPPNVRAAGDRPVDDDLEALSVADAAKRLGISRSKFYELIGRNEIPSITIGTRRLIPLRALRNWVDEQTS